MSGLVIPGVDATATVVSVCSAAAVGVLGLFGGDADLRGIARRLDTDEDPSEIERALDDLEDAIDAVVADADLDRHADDPPAPDATSVEKAKALERAVADGRLSVGPSSAPPDASGDRTTDRGAAGHRTAERELDRETVADATDALTEAAADAADLGVGPDSNRSVAERLRRLADAVERDEVSFAESGDAGRVASVAREVRQSQGPNSVVADRLLDRLASPELGDLEAALDTAVEHLNAATTTRSVVDDLDHEAVADLADDVASQLDDAEGPLAEVVAERVGELRGRVERADESNAVVPYAAREELRFYDGTLVSHLDEPEPREASSGGADGAINAVAERREEIERRYVDGRHDHNHTIPLHFLSLVDALLEEAERAAATGDADRADGLRTAAEETLDRVEQLYEYNEYSVMLRRLRG